MAPRFTKARDRRVTFVVDGAKLTVDRPHPRKECGKGLVKRVREYLKTIGELPDTHKDEQEEEP